MKWLTDSCNTKKVSLPPLSRLWRNCPGSSSDSKTISYPPPVWASISAIKSRCFSAQERGYRGYTPWGTLWFYLSDHEEDMRKWDGKPTSILEARVCELQGKTITKGDSPRKSLTPPSSGQFSRQIRKFDLTSDPLEGPSKSLLQEVSNKYSDQD